MNGTVEAVYGAVGWEYVGLPFRGIICRRDCLDLVSQNIDNCQIAGFAGLTARSIIESGGEATSRHCCRQRTFFVFLCHNVIDEESR
jgi:hypothetical protein